MHAPFPARPLATTPAAQPLQGGLPVSDYSTDNSTWNKSGKQKTAGITSREDELNAAEENVRAAQQRKADAEIEREKAEAEHARAVEVERANHEAEIVRREEEHADAIALKQANFEKESEAAAKTAKISDYWDDMSTGRRILAAVLIGASSAVGGNAKDIYDGAAARYRQTQLDAHEAALEKAKAAGASRDQLVKMRDEMRDRMKIQEDAREKRLAASLKVIESKHPQAAVRAQAMLADLDEKAATRRLENEKTYAPDVSRGGSHGTVTGKAAAGGSAPSPKSLAEQEGLEQDAKQDEEERDFRAANPDLIQEAKDRVAEFNSKNWIRDIPGIGGAAQSLPIIRNIVEPSPIRPDDSPLMQRAIKYQVKEAVDIAKNVAGKGMATTKADNDAGKQLGGPTVSVEESSKVADDKARASRAIADAAKGRAGVTVTTGDKTPDEQYRADRAVKAGADAGAAFTQKTKKEYADALRTMSTKEFKAMPAEAKDLFFQDYPLLRKKK